MSKSGHSPLARPSAAVSAAWDALWRHRGRTLLAMLGIIIGVAGVIAAVAVGGGGKTVILGEMADWGADVLVVRPQYANYRPNTPVTYLAAADLEGFQALPGVKAVAPYRWSSRLVRSARRSVATDVLETTPGYQSAFHIRLRAGRFLLPDDLTLGRPVAVIEPDLARTLFGVGEEQLARALGQRFTVDGVEVEVVGITERAQAGVASRFLGPLDDAVVPLTLFGRRQWQEGFRSAYIQVESPALVPRLAREIQRFLTARYGDVDGKPRFSAQPPQDVVETVKLMLNILQGIIWGISLITLGVGGIGIINVMLVSLREQVWEVGLRRALGARRSDIFTQFLAQSLLLALGGGTLGVLLGLLGTMVGALAADLPWLLAPRTVATAFAVSVAEGVFFGLYPAWRAARLAPVEALRVS